MTFATFSLSLTIAGAAVLVALVYALQRLRPRRRVVMLPAARLWAQAMREAPVRTLGGRFRYWLAYLLILAIALLLWLAAAHPQFAARGGGAAERFYLDDSALLGDPGALARAKRALLADVRATAAARREVFAGDVRLLSTGESASLLSYRLDAVRWSARPSDFAGWLARQGGPATVRYYGAWAGARNARSVGANLRVRYGYLADPVPGNRGIVAFGATPAASGAWGKADVLVAVAARDGAVPAPAALRWTLDGVSFRPAVEVAGRGRYRVRDVAAAGGVLGVALVPGDGFVADDGAWLLLPDRRPIRVALLDGTPPAIRRLVQVDEGVRIVPAAQAQVLVGSDAAIGGSETPALMIAPTGPQPAFVFAGPEVAARGELADRLDQLGLGQIDAGAMADALHRPISVEVRDAPRRSVSAWGALFAAPSPFATTAAMPLFVGQSLRWLAVSDGSHPYAKAGAPVANQAALYGLDTPDDALAAVRGDRPMSLTDRATTLAVADGDRAPAITRVAGAMPADGPYVLLLALAAVLLGVEWWLVQRGRMP